MFHVFDSGGIAVCCKPFLPKETAFTEIALAK